MFEKSLGIEITPSQIKAVEMDASATPPKVYRFAAFELLSPHPENISRQIRSTMSHMKFRTRKARVAVEADNAHHIILLPPMPKKEMNVVVEREMKDLLGNRPQEMVFGWQILGDDKKGKKRVLATAASSESLRDKSLLLKDAGLLPDLITTEPSALFNASQLIEGVDIGTSCLVHLGEGRGHAVFMRNGKWAFYRNLPGSGTDREELVEEINRAFLYFRHQFRGEEVARVFLSGECGSGTKSRLSETFGVKAVSFSPYLDLSPLKERAEEFRRYLPEFIVPIGLAGKRATDSISLRDPETSRRLRQAGLKKTAVLGLILAVLMMGASYGYLFQRISQYKRVLVDKRHTLNKFKPYLTARQARSLHENHLALLKKIDDHAHWAEALRELSRTVAPEIALQSLRFKRQTEKITLTIKGAVVTPQELAGREILSRFYTQWESSPLLANVALEPTSIKFVRSEGSDARGPARMEFEVKGDLAAVEIEYEVD